ncbi:hypothetical protein [Prauserella muralis]|uniref:Uncharacterized protein n=1 Tax=Prauserella muralis TaxID=588067 RepID=A0A2V4B7K7_9PSEU|nr:hypothetical protein [Prauserella muralis]PXY31101.1 hypothetical protein BAY60_01410 [Prauserella muralis]TWE14611.1 hypothetical protein FHX69_6768 [Prauserella muralis]
MSSARIASKTARKALFPLLDEDVSAVAREEAMAAEVAEIDALVEEMEREWAAADRVESLRVSRDFTDQVRARRTHRRADRTVLRSLPTRLGVSACGEGEAA